MYEAIFFLLYEYVENSFIIIYQTFYIFIFKSLAGIRSLSWMNMIPYNNNDMYFIFLV